jgi:hypothetical protein
LAAEHVASVREFNQRIVKAGWGDFQLQQDPALNAGDGPAKWECWLALQDGVVRGGYQLKNLEFAFGGELRPVAFYNLSISESVIDRMYAAIGPRMATHAVAGHPLAFALGMGGTGKPLPRLLKGLGWDVWEVPFLFRVLRPARVLRGLAALRTTAFRRLAADVGAATGVPSAVTHIWQGVKRLRTRAARFSVREVPHFDAWADDVWNECKGSYAMISRRDCEALAITYPPSFERIVRLAVESDGAVAGWAIIRATRHSGHKQFGDLYVGSIVDCLARSDAAIPAVVEAATDFLEDRGVDLIVTNQAHHTWRAALERDGYLLGPSNFALAVSKDLGRQVGPLEANAGNIHINRGDGDGPIHL